MPADSAQIALERVLAAVGQRLDRQSAEPLLRLRADTEMQGRIEELADKCTEGRLTPEERDEYEAMIRVGNFVAILQARTRRLPQVRPAIDHNIWPRGEARSSMHRI